MAKTAYVLSKRIARGGMAEIYLGKAVGENAFQRICAIKRILPHYAQDKEFIEMFRDEAHICKRLQQANIVQVYDFTEVEGSYALIMEHVDGADLRTLLSACEGARIRVSVPMALYMAASCLRGLHYAHTKVDEITNLPLGIVHRDVSPQNILISYEGEVKITDFGIAAAEDKITETRPGVVKGKYSYMSPEQVSAKPLDGRSDVFSLAIVVWECLAMKRLFAGQTEVETIRKVQNCEIPYKLHELNPEVDEALTRLVEKGLAKDRKKRYQTSASFEKALLKYLNSKYPDFTPSELGNFLKQILAKKRGETQDDIKQVLTSTDLRRQSSRPGDGAGAREPSVGSSLSEPATPIATGEPVFIEASSVRMSLDDNATTKGRLTADRTGSYKPRPFQPTQTARLNVYRQSQRNELSKRSRSSRGSQLLGFLVLLVAIGGVYLYRTGGQLFDDKMHFELKASPEVITLAINGKSLNHGSYTRTPVKLHLKPGSYQLTVARPGYQSKIIDFQGNAGDTIAPPLVNLERKSGGVLMSVRILAKDKRVYVNVDGGLAKGATPLFVPNLQAGVSHTLSFSTSDTDGKKVLRCLFKPLAVNEANVYTVTIDPEAPDRNTCVGRPH